MYVADTNTVTTVNYTDWRTISGSRVHAVIVLVTEAILVGESMVKLEYSRSTCPVERNSSIASSSVGLAQYDIKKV